MNKQILENEPKIVKRAKKEDEAFEILYNFYFPKIYGYLFKRTGDYQATQDLTSITFTKVFCNLSKYKSKGGSFSAWVYKIATNNLIDHYRKSGRNREVSLENAQNLKSDNPDPEQLMQIAQDQKTARIILTKLSTKYQKIIHLKFFAELSNQEISVILGVSQNNTRVLIYRALKNFKKIYEKEQK